MNKRILVAGCSDYEREYFKNGKYSVHKDFYLKNLYDNYKIDNLSKNTLTIEDAFILTKAFTSVYEYEMVILALGEGDTMKNTDVTTYRNTLKEILKYLKEKNVPFVFGTGKRFGEYTDINDEFAESLKNKKSSEELLIMPKLA